MVEVFLVGEQHPVYGWPASLTDIEPHIQAVRQDLDHKYLNDIEGLAIPSLENVARWIWRRLEGDLPRLDRITIRRGQPGHGEGCTWYGPAEPGFTQRG